MPMLALALFAIYLALAFGLRALTHRRLTGSSSFEGISGRLGSVEWFGGVLFAASLALHFTAPLLDLTGVVGLVFVSGPAGWFGAALIILGAAGTLAAQGSMGASWRIGVDGSERTELVTRGPFAMVRNPIFAAMIPASLGMVLMVPNVAAAAALLSLVAAIELQVRFVEEPCLIRVHGQTYLDYASRTGRLLPGVGRLRRRAPR
ncbi:isoprenylcysteine carboxylmethyltransferase family protein [soil metagenome]